MMTPQPPAPQYDPQDVFANVVAQRNAILTEVAVAQAVIKAKDARIAELEKQLADLKPKVD
jgi:hypothetical protein